MNVFFKAIPLNKSLKFNVGLQGPLGYDDVMPFLDTLERNTILKFIVSRNMCKALKNIFMQL